MFHQVKMEKMAELEKKYFKAKNWTRTSQKNVDKFYEALGLEREEDSSNKKIAINCYEGEWMISTSSPNFLHSTQVRLLENSFNDFFIFFY